MNALGQSVKKTVAFFDVLDLAPTLEEVHIGLFGADAPAEELLRVLGDSSLYLQEDGFYALRGREELFALRREKIRVSEDFLKKARRFSFLFRLVPGIAGVAVCNNVALKNALRESDIDLFVVVKPGRLFLARTMLTLLFHCFGVRRHRARIAGRFCLSFFVAEDRLDLGPLQRAAGEDPYLALWCASLQPIFGQPSLWRQFREINSYWLENYFPSRFQKSVGARNENFRDSASPFVRLLENFLAEYQLARIRRKTALLQDASGIVASRSILKFHNVDRRKEFFEEWMRRQEQILK